jgi:hypothetical protein
MAQDFTAGHWSLGCEAHYGFIFAHRPSIQPLQRSHLGGAVITISRPANGRKRWHHDFHLPETGIKYGFFGLGNKEQLGYGHTIYPYIDIQLGKRSNHLIHFQFGWGLGYITRPYNRLNNYKNVAIGSHLNAVIAFNFHTEIKLSERDFLSPAIGLTHFSNGSAAMPNLGVNLTTIQLHYRHAFAVPFAIQSMSYPKFNPVNRISFFGSGSFKQVYPLAGKTWYAASLSGAYLRQYSSKSAAGAGWDVFYDPSIKYRLQEEENKNPSNVANIRLGLSGAYEIIFSDFSVVLQMGAYVKNDWKKDGTWYNRLGMRYSFRDHIFACINLKTHIARADFIEWGLGYTIIK